MQFKVGDRVSMTQVVENPLTMYGMVEAIKETGRGTKIKVRFNSLADGRPMKDAHIFSPRQATEHLTRL
jgi:hypothetical protein